MAVFAAFVLLGLLNVFGQAASTSRASTPAATLTVSSPETLRGGLLYQVSIDIVAKRDLAKAMLVMSPGWFSGLTTNAEVPQPSPQQSDGGRVEFALGALHAGDHRSIHVYFQVNPTTVAWRRAADVELDDGTTREAIVERSITVYP
jgi:hypothetical protein